MKKDKTENTNFYTNLKTRIFALIHTNDRIKL